MIKVRVSPNERMSGRTEFMRDAITHFRRGEFNVAEEDIPCDVIFEENGRIFAVELKTLKDFHASTSTDRFCRQLLSFIEAGEPCAILVFGSYKELMNSIPEFDSNGLRSPRQAAVIRRIIDEILYECYGLYVPILFLDKNPLTSFIFLLNAAMKILRGGCAANMVPKPDKAQRKMAILGLIDGVGKNTANALMHEYSGSLGDLIDCLKNNYDRITKVRVGNKCISSQTAKNIAEAFS